MMSPHQKFNSVTGRAHSKFKCPWLAHQELNIHMHHFISRTGPKTLLTAHKKPYSTVLYLLTKTELKSSGHRSTAHRSTIHRSTTLVNIERDWERFTVRFGEEREIPVLSSPFPLWTLSISLSPDLYYKLKHVLSTSFGFTEKNERLQASFFFHFLGSFSRQWSQWRRPL